MTGRLKVYDVDTATWRYVDSVVPTVNAPVVSTDTATNYSTNSTTPVDIGAPYTKSIVAPASGRILVLGSVDALNPNTGAIADVTFYYRVDSGADVACGGHAFQGATEGSIRIAIPLSGVITGLTPGQTYSVALRWAVSSGTTGLDGSTRGGAKMGSRFVLVPLA